MAAANENQQRPLNQFSWQKGQSGNPAGTTKKVREVRDMLAKLHPDCEKALRCIIEDWQGDRRSALGAIQIVYARSIGKERESLYTPKDRAAALGSLEAVDVKKLPDSALDELDAVLKKYAT